MDSLYFEYNPNATESNGSCYTLVLPGCMNDFADNYDPSANMSDSSCLFNNIQEPFIYVSNPINGLIYPQDIFSDVILLSLFH